MDAEGKVLLTQEEFNEYRKKKIVLASSVSPDTGETIMWPCRTSALVPTNIPIIAGMLCSPPTPFYIILLQMVN